MSCFCCYLCVKVVESPSGLLGLETNTILCPCAFRCFFAVCFEQLLVDVFVLPLERWAKDLEALRDSDAASESDSLAPDLTQEGKWTGW